MPASPSASLKTASPPASCVLVRKKVPAKTENALSHLTRIWGRRPPSSRSHGLVQNLYPLHLRRVILFTSSALAGMKRHHPIQQPGSGRLSCLWPSEAKHKCVSALLIASPRPPCLPGTHSRSDGDTVSFALVSIKACQVPWGGIAEARFPLS